MLRFLGSIFINSQRNIVIDGQFLFKFTKGINERQQCPQNYTTGGRTT